jgi:hypothetical protein
MEVRLLFYIEERVMKIQLLKKLMIMSVLILSSASTIAYAVAGPVGKIDEQIEVKLLFGGDIYENEN